MQYLSLFVVSKKTVPFCNKLVQLQLAFSTHHWQLDGILIGQSVLNQSLNNRFTWIVLNSATCWVRDTLKLTFLAFGDIVYIYIWKYILSLFGEIRKRNVINDKKYELLLANNYEKLENNYNFEWSKLHVRICIFNLVFSNQPQNNFMINAMTKQQQKKILFNIKNYKCIRIN